MTILSQRLTKRILRDFAELDQIDAIRLVVESSDTERIQAAAVLWAKGDLSRLRDIAELIHTDFRDALVRAGLEHDDWRQVLDAELNP